MLCHRIYCHSLPCELNLLRELRFCQRKGIIWPPIVTFPNCIAENGNSVYGNHGYSHFLQTVLLQLLICLTTFYAVYYITGSIFFGAFRLETYDVLIPFDFKTEPSCPSSKYIVNLMSMELTYFVCGLLYAGVVKEWLWDYAITVTLIHIAITSTVMAEFPLVWHWWLALGCALLLMIGSGHLLVHFAFQDNLIYPLLDDF